MSDTPNPGSLAARELGCTCPVLDNGHGRRPPIPPGVWGTGPEGGWYIYEDCPVHAVGAEA